MQESTKIAGLYVRLRKLRIKLREAHRKGDRFAAESLQLRLEDLKALLRAELATAEPQVEEPQEAA